MPCTGLPKAALLAPATIPPATVLIERPAAPAMAPPVAAVTAPPTAPMPKAAKPSLQLTKR